VAADLVFDGDDLGVGEHGFDFLAAQRKQHVAHLFLVARAMPLAWRGG
jgi:hypothetical protein